MFRVRGRMWNRHRQRRQRRPRRPRRWHQRRWRHRSVATVTSLLRIKWRRYLSASRRIRRPSMTPLWWTLRRRSRIASRKYFRTPPPKTPKWSPIRWILIEQRSRIQWSRIQRSRSPMKSPKSSNRKRKRRRRRKAVTISQWCGQRRRRQMTVKLILLQSRRIDPRKQITPPKQI